MMHLTLFSVLLLSPFISGETKVFSCSSLILNPDCSFHETFPEATSLTATCDMSDLNLDLLLSPLRFQVSTDGQTFNNAKIYEGTRTFTMDINSPTFLAEVITGTIYNIKCTVSSNTTINGTNDNYYG
ncbi:UNVERIFIED_CONTAM: hypothetical protein RMT77_010563 [Armadillidium vulgare]